MHFAKWKNPDPKVYILYDFIYILFWKKQNYENKHQIIIGQGLGNYKGDA